MDNKDNVNIPENKSGKETEKKPEKKKKTSERCYHCNKK